MARRKTLILELALLCALLLVFPAVAQDAGDGDEGNGSQQSEDDAAGPPPEIPSMEEVISNRAELEDFVPMDFDFRIGVVGDFKRQLNTTAGVQEQVKTPLLVIDPRDGDVGIHAQNFPAKILDASRSGRWLVGIAPSYAVDGSSGSKDKESSVSLNLGESRIDLIEEFPLHSRFQAFFASNDNNAIYYCVNEPAAVNKIHRYNLESKEEREINLEGNRFYMYGLKPGKPDAIWIEDPMNLTDDPVLLLIDVETGQQIDKVKFPGATEVVANADGTLLLAIVSRGAEASIGYYDTVTRSFNQISGLVLTRPTVKWANSARRIYVQESTTVRDRLLEIDLDTQGVRELFSGYFKIGQWDISPSDDAIVFITDQQQEPSLFVLPLDPELQDVTNRIRLNDVSNVTWIGCIYPPETTGGGSWLDNLMPF